MQKSMQILVVDDDDRERLLLETLLTRMGNGYKVVAVRNGQEALEIAKHTTFDVLLTDLQMPTMNGVALTETFMALHPQARIIWITAYGCHQYKYPEQWPVCCCLDKPVEIGKIRRAVLQALGQGRKT